MNREKMIDILLDAEFEKKWNSEEGKEFRCAVLDVLYSENDGWIPVEEDRKPESGEYVLVSFENFSLPEIARYEEDEEGGTFYPGDEERSYKSYGLFVNAWIKLPKRYCREDDEEQDQEINPAMQGIMRRFMEVR